MDPREVDAAHEAKIHLVIAAAERQLGDERFGGAWTDRTTSSPWIGIAVVQPMQADVDVIEAAGRMEGWRIELVAVRYSRANLLGMLEPLSKAGLPGDAWLTLGWDPRLRAIRAELHRWDDEAASWLYERLPHDAVTIIVRPGVRIVAAQGSTGHADSSDPSQ